jgi:hypothetical protein
MPISLMSLGCGVLELELTYVSYVCVYRKDIAPAILREGCFS